MTGKRNKIKRKLIGFMAGEKGAIGKLQALALGITGLMAGGLPKTAHAWWSGDMTLGFTTVTPDTENLVTVPSQGTPLQEINLSPVYLDVPPLPPPPPPTYSDAPPPPPTYSDAPPPPPTYSDAPPPPPTYSDAPPPPPPPVWSQDETPPPPPVWSQDETPPPPPPPVWSGNIWSSNWPSDWPSNWPSDWPANAPPKVEGVITE